VYQVDPFGARETVVITHGSQGGGWEAFDLDTRNPNQLFAFLTEDVADGAVQRMTIQNPDYTNSWDVLLGNGPVDYLFLESQKVSSTERVVRLGGPQTKRRHEPTRRDIIQRRKDWRWTEISFV